MTDLFWTLAALLGVMGLAKFLTWCLSDDIDNPG